MSVYQALMLMIAFAT
ncbi:putative holin-like toxin [Lactococcus lactis]